MKRQIVFAILSLIILGGFLFIALQFTNDLLKTNDEYYTNMLEALNKTRQNTQQTYVINSNNPLEIIEVIE